MGYADGLKSRKYYLDVHDSALHVYRAFQIVDDLVYVCGILDSGGGGGGSVNSFAFTDANGFTGVVSNPTTNPNLTLSISDSGVTSKVLTGFTSVNSPILSTDSILAAFGKAQGQINSILSSSVLSVSGTTNRITSTGGTNPVIDISALYVGQSSISTVGTLTSGSTGAGFTISLSASTISGVLLGANGGTGVNNSGRTITLSGNLITSGAFNTTFTQVATTNLTLPNGNGTLATTSRVEAFTNKSLDPSNTIEIYDRNLILDLEADPSSQARFDCSLISSGNLRTYSFPDSDGTLALTSDIIGVYVPYTGASISVLLGNNSLTARSVILGSSSNTIAMGSTAGVSSVISSTTNATKGDITIGGIVNINESSLIFRVNTPTTIDSLTNAIISSTATNRKNLVLQTFPSQVANAFELQNSSGTVLNAISSTTGGFSIGITPSDLWLIGTTYNFTAADNQDKFGYLNVVSISNTAGLVGSLIGNSIQPTNLVGASVFGSLIGSRIIPTFNSAGFVFSGFFVGQEIRMQTGASQTGVVSDAIAYRLNAPVFTGNKPATNWGYLINNQGFSGVTNSYAIDIAAQSGSINSYAITSALGNLHGFGTNTPNKTVDVSGDIQLKSAGNGFYVKEGTNATMGVATFVAGTVVVSTNKVTANSRIFLSRQSSGTNIGSEYVSTRSAGVSFTISSTNTLDTGTVAWIIIEPAP